MWQKVPHQIIHYVKSISFANFSLTSFHYLFSDFLPARSFQGWESIRIFNLSFQLQRCKITTAQPFKIKEILFSPPHSHEENSWFISSSLEVNSVFHTISKLFLPKYCLTRYPKLQNREWDLFPSWEKIIRPYAET